MAGPDPCLSQEDAKTTATKEVWKAQREYDNDPQIKDLDNRIKATKDKKQRAALQDERVKLAKKHTSAIETAKEKLDDADKALRKCRDEQKKREEADARGPVRTGGGQSR